jgi:hypothetical protein
MNQLLYVPYPPSTVPSIHTTMSSIQPPIPPRIPQSHVQSLIPRLTTTINDIDSFKTLLAQGSHDGTMPNWYVQLTKAHERNYQTGT